MGDENHVRTLGDYSKPSHEGYMNTIKLPVGNNVVPLRSDTIWLVQNGCSFHGLWSEDPNQHLKDFLKLVDSLDLDDENRERTGKLRDRNAKESWALLEDLALYDNENLNDPKDFAKSVKAITLPKDVSSTSDRRLIELILLRRYHSGFEQGVEVCVTSIFFGLSFFPFSFPFLVEEDSVCDVCDSECGGECGGEWDLGANCGVGWVGGIIYVGFEELPGAPKL
ncbi:hypothetical protein Tco_0581613 [Tanacetum coccineum]